jgi:hypothetical protein
MYFDFLYKFCLKHFSFWEEFSEILSQMDIGLHVKYNLLSDFKEISIFSIDFWDMLKYQFSCKSIQWELNCSMWTEGQIDKQTDRQTHDNAKSLFRNSANAPKNETKWGTSITKAGMAPHDAVWKLWKTQEHIFITKISLLQIPAVLQ